MLRLQLQYSELRQRCDIAGTKVRAVVLKSLLLSPFLLLLLCLAQLMPCSHALLSTLYPLFCLNPIQPCIVASRAQIFKAPGAVVMRMHLRLAAHSHEVPCPRPAQSTLHRLPFC